MIKKLKIIQKYLQENILSFILGCLIIIFIIWNRAIREHLPKTLSDFYEPFMIIIVSINIILNVIIIIITFWIVFYNNKGKERNRFIAYIIKNTLVNKIFYYSRNISEKIANSPKTVYKLIFNLWNVSYILERPFYKLSHFIKNLPIKYTFILTIIHLVFHTIPKAVPAIIFTNEIFFLGQLKYFYVSLYLYIIIILYQSLLWILADLADTNTYYITAHINIDYLDDCLGEYTATFKTKMPDIEDAVDIVSRKYDQQLLDWFVYNYDIYVDIKWLVYKLNLKKNKLRYNETLFVTILYLLGWSYILFTYLYT